jgi:hypothetical protein
MKKENSKTGQLDKTDLKSITHYFIILFLWALVATLPQLTDLLVAQWFDPTMVGFIVAYLWIIAKKFLQDNSK